MWLIVVGEGCGCGGEEGVWELEWRTRVVLRGCRESDLYVCVCVIRVESSVCRR